MSAASTRRACSSWPRVTRSSGWWASNGSPGPKLAAGTPCSQKEATSVQPTLALGAAPLLSTRAASSGCPSEGGAPSPASTSSHSSSGSSNGWSSSADERLGLGALAIGRVAMIEDKRGPIGYHVAGDAPLDGHGLELLGVGAAVEHDLTPAPGGDGVDQGTEPVDGIAPGERTCRMGPHSLQRDAAPAACPDSRPPPERTWVRPGWRRRRPADRDARPRVGAGRSPPDPPPRRRRSTR